MSTFVQKSVVRYSGVPIMDRRKAAAKAKNARKAKTKRLKVRTSVKAGSGNYGW